MEDGRFERAVRALFRHGRRLAHLGAPVGWLDVRGWWHPSPQRTSAVEHARAPNSTSAHAYRRVGRSLQHCEALEGADHDATVQVRNWVKAQEALTGHDISDPIAYRLGLRLEQTLRASCLVRQARRNPRPRL
jgi:hypothetical protein